MEIEQEHELAVTIKATVYVPADKNLHLVTPLIVNALQGELDGFEFYPANLIESAALESVSVTLGEQTERTAASWQAEVDQLRGQRRDRTRQVTFLEQRLREHGIDPYPTAPGLSSEAIDGPGESQPTDVCPRQGCSGHLNPLTGRCAKCGATAPGMPA